MLTRLLRLAALALALQLSACAGVGQEGASSVSGASGVTGSPSPTGTTATVAPTVLSSPTDIPEASFHEVPPPADASPGIAANEAVEAAFVQGAPNISSAQAVLVVFTGGFTDTNTGRPQYQDVLAWDVIEKGCFVRPAPSPLPGTEESLAPCASTEHSIVDATTGKLLLSIDI